MALVEVPYVVAIVQGQPNVLQVAQARLSDPPSETEPPPVIGPAVLMVTAPDPVRRELPMVEVETTTPCWLVERRALARLENPRAVVVAL